MCRLTKNVAVKWLSMLFHMYEVRNLFLGPNTGGY